MTYQLWIEERDKAVWHKVTNRMTGATYAVVCGWEMTANDRVIYPQKSSEPGPLEERRCNSCVELG